MAALSRPGFPSNFPWAFDDLFGFFPHLNFDANRHYYGQRSYPPLNVWEDAEGFHLEAEIPGMKQEEFGLSVEDNVLTLRGERKAPSLEGAKTHRSERPLGKFARTIRLPAEIDESNISAHYQNGVLSLLLPKKVPARPKKIEIKVL